MDPSSNDPGAGMRQDRGSNACSGEHHDRGNSPLPTTVQSTRQIATNAPDLHGASKDCVVKRDDQHCAYTADGKLTGDFRSRIEVVPAMPAKGSAS
jgi:hypothetical protein